jgi:beta-galactosidase/beta-glucuronidase
VRPDWLCLNGAWEFEIDADDTGLERGLLGRPLAREIVVPFCPESRLSGIGEPGFMEAVWYRRRVQVPAEWAGRWLLLHFQAVDQDATVWVDGAEVARHRGGWTPFAVDLGPVTGARELELVVRARDPREGAQPRGKQSDRLESYGCFYTRTTGIWQTVWLEPVPASHLLRPRITPDLSESTLHVEVAVRRPSRGLAVRARLADGEGEVAVAESAADLDFTVRLVLPVPAGRRRLWSPDDPFLYDLELELVDGAGALVDRAESYAGLRAVSIDGRAVLLNGEPVFQRLVLDQGYYPDGVMTAPTDEALVRDIELSRAAGFNGARLHQKVFEERFLHHCDRLGYLVWGEFGDWGAGRDVEATPSFITQWLEVLERDYSHPAIVGWCPLNETLEGLGDRITTLDDVTRGLFLAAKAFDQTRPVLDVSGFSHRVPETDVYDVHDYDQDPVRLAASHAGLAEGRAQTDLQLDVLGEVVDEELPAFPALPWSVPYRGQPYFVSEFGGIGWADPDDEEAWGYGSQPASLEELHVRFEGLVAVLLGNEHMFGYCYTQLTDIEQEQNGVYRYDRTPKFDLERIRAAQQQPAAIELRSARGLPRA